MDQIRFESTVSLQFSKDIFEIISKEAIDNLSAFTKKEVIRENIKCVNARYSCYVDGNNIIKCPNNLDLLQLVLEKDVDNMINSKIFLIWKLKINKEVILAIKELLETNNFNDKYFQLTLSVDAHDRFTLIAYKEMEIKYTPKILEFLN